MARTSIERGIARIPNGHYRVRVSYEGRQHSVGTFYTLGDARAALAIARSEVARRTFVPSSERRRLRKAVAETERRQAVTVREWSETWLQGLADAGRSPGTLTSYRSTLNVHVLDVIGDKRLADVTADDVNDLMADVRKRKGPAANVARTVRAMFASAAEVEAGGLTASPVRVSVPKARRARTLAADEIPTAADVAALRGAMPPGLAVAVDLAAWCALRLGEVLGLQRRDLELDDADDAVLHVRRQWNTKASPPAYGPPKRGSERTVSIPPDLVPVLRDHRQRYAGPGTTGPLLPSARDKSRPVSQTQFDAAWRVARESADVAFRFHDLRHAGLTQYARQGATLAELMARGGHSDVAAAMIYQTATRDRDKALVAKLSVRPGVPKSADAS